jgi:hypothetical protein
MLPPNAKLTRLVDAAVEPLSLADAKGYLRVETTAEDTLISDMITAARLECEHINDRSFITTSWQLTLDYLPAIAYPFNSLEGRWGTWSCQGGMVGFGGGITLPSPPLIALTSMTYIDMSGVTQSINVSPGSPSIIVTGGTPGRIDPAYGTFFPLSQPRPAAVNIIYTAGYGPDATTVPKSVIMAMRLLVAHYHRHRTINAQVPDAVANLLSCTWWGGYA